MRLDPKQFQMLAEKNKQIKKTKTKQHLFSQTCHDRDCQFNGTMRLIKLKPTNNLIVRIELLFYNLYLCDEIVFARRGLNINVICKKMLNYSVGPTGIKRLNTATTKWLNTMCEFGYRKFFYWHQPRLI